MCFQQYKHIMQLHFGTKELTTLTDRKHYSFADREKELGKIK